MKNGKYKSLDASFYSREPEVVAKELLGKLLIRKLDNEYLIGVIIETEAYLPYDDPAAHSFIGKTKRNEALFGEPGTLYIHSMHGNNLIDIVCCSLDIPGSVLIRALKPIEGIEKMKELRNTNDIKNLTSGPGKLCKALNILKDHNKLDITKENAEIFIANPTKSAEIEIQNSARIGINKNKEVPLRFFIK